MKGYHIRESDDYCTNLEFIVDGINYSLERIAQYNQETAGGILDLNIEFESTLGLAMVPMQVYVNMTIINCFIVLQSKLNPNFHTIDYKTIISRELPHFQERCFKIDAWDNREFTRVELINALANCYKHRNELEPMVDRILFHGTDSVQLKDDVFRKGTKDVLNNFGLLSTDEWADVNPVTKGVAILDSEFNLSNISDYLIHNWRQKCWEYTRNELKKASR